MDEAKKSKFQFSNPRIKRLNFEVNTMFDNSKYNGIGTSINTQVSNRESSCAEVEMTVSLGKEKDSVPFSLEISVVAIFKWEDDIQEELVNELLNKNAKVLLLSYLRPFITHVIVDAGYPPLVLPFYDFSEE